MLLLKAKAHGELQSVALPGKENRSKGDLKC
jgi:hypothetical protein